mmetsp:Transcript_13362/g.53199  ORF Transcript_13362/g.53199 Transcript_13362/m.53199 type:complete len:521 (-) Transcript_13362:45-1607(-)
MWTTLLVAIVVAALTYFGWKKFSAKAGPVEVPKKPLPRATPSTAEDVGETEELEEEEEDGEEMTSPVVGGHSIPDIKAAFTEEDWAQLLESGVEEHVEKHTSIMAEGEPNSDIYRLVQGTIEITHQRNGQREVLRTVSEPGYVVGEMTAVSNLLKATATVTATKDSKLIRLSNRKLMAVIEDNYALGIRFHRYIGRLLKDRLEEVNRVSKNLTAAQSAADLAEKPKESKKKKIFTRKKELDLEALNKKAHKRFPSLPSLQILARKCTVVLMRNGSKRAGTLYVLPSYLAFYSKIFGMVQKTMIPLRDISNVDCEEHRPKFFINFTQKTRSLATDELEETAVRVILLRADDYEFLRAHLFDHKATAEGLINDAPPEGFGEDVDNAALSRRMTEDDWDLILTDEPHDLLKEYEEGDVIIESGSFHPRVFQMVSGAADVVVSGSIVGNIKPTDLFGEIQYLTKSPAGATVTASCHTSCYVIDGKRLDNQLLREHPYTVEKFYHYLITVLIKRLCKREAYLRQA